MAAVYVAATHVVLALNPPALVGLPFRFGQEAVIIFFLMSGAVIYLATQNRPGQSFGTYFEHRFRRIYFPFATALIVSAIVAAATGALVDQFSFGQLLGNLAMLQDDGSTKPGTWIGTFLGDLPLWSLSYEWWFYLLFWPTYRWVPRQHQLPAVTLVSLLAWLAYLAHPNHILLVASYAVIWWAGLELARVWVEDGALTWRRCGKPLACLTAMSIAAAIPIVLEGPRGFGLYPVLTFRHFATGTVFAVMTVAWSKLGWIGFRVTIGPFAPIAPISYAIYVLHYPILVRWGVASGKWWVLLGLCLPVLLLAAYLVEVVGQRQFNRLVARVFHSRTVPEVHPVGHGHINS
ncbi:hypothetical protein Kisp02_54700 [Kineosporia sp. NBRC 101731]|nr:hypothetical protein Kisp02_54700 [Kineosporia sp. NBRC 101731]